MPNAIFCWKHYTRSFPAEKTGWWKMASETEINHAKAVQGVCMKWTSGSGLLNCLFFFLPPSPFFFFSQLFEGVLRAKRQVNGLDYTFFAFSFSPSSLHLREESRPPHVGLISRHKHRREKKNCSIPVGSSERRWRKNKLRISNFLSLKKRETLWF